MPRTPQLSGETSGKNHSREFTATKLGSLPHAHSTLLLEVPPCYRMELQLSCSENSLMGLSRFFKAS